jgi:hypothetical protein
LVILQPLLFESAGKAIEKCHGFYLSPELLRCSFLVYPPQSKVLRLETALGIACTESY